MDPAYNMTAHLVELVDAIRLNKDTDTVISCGDEPIIKAHSFILKARSPVLRDIYDRELSKSSNYVLDFPTYSFECVDIVIKYIQTSLITAELDNANIPLLCEIHKFSQWCELDALNTHVSDLLERKADNIIGAINVLHHCDDEDIESHALWIILAAIKSENQFPKEIDKIHIEDSIKIKIFDYILKRHDVNHYLVF